MRTGAAHIIIHQLMTISGVQVAPSGVKVTWEAIANLSDFLRIPNILVDLVERYCSILSFSRTIRTISDGISRLRHFSLLHDFSTSRISTSFSFLYWRCCFPLAVGLTESTFQPVPSRAFLTKKIENQQRATSSHHTTRPSLSLTGYNISLSTTIKACKRLLNPYHDTDTPFYGRKLPPSSNMTSDCRLVEVLLSPVSTT
ncbi:uncharacterized protein K452DRAFT_119347 [Aplosporella prunicola CBS 121167]|uniref:Uncharacterized protein n=1 Tax=Aplosporella prunicola CBS 121167 TaxID=1176127 RepID=A0A6A6BMU4_9PEZI|nr:uncharacterized protein K452DRAFT_119347 [Aplosporella prunicola CBS 121167]KAF2145386.1 hypothetical protein K452DRAFT_119347 [Aplosporella prunicola CBS 121167]